MDLEKSTRLYGEHTDYSGFTFLWRNKTNGLQAKVDDDWYDVPLLEEDQDALLINLGDLMEFWTNATWHSPLHRVVNTSPHHDLVSIVMFTGMKLKVSPKQSSSIINISTFVGPHPDTPIKPLKSEYIEKAEDSEIIFTAKQHVLRKIKKTAV